MKNIKKILKNLIPEKALYYRRLIRDKKLKDYFVERKHFIADKKYTPNDLPVYLSIAVIVKNETPYIAEWIEYHLLMGVERFYIYDNESSDNLKDYLDPYIKEGIVEYIYFPGERRQLAVYNDAIKRYRYACFWLAFIDIDEFLAPLAAETVSDFLREFEDAPGIEINQVLYGSGGHQTKTDALVIERFKDHSPYDIPLNRGVKSIVNPRSVFYMRTAHTGEYFDGERSVDADNKKNFAGSLDRPALHDKIRINHYGCKSYEEFVSRIDLGRASSQGKLPVEEFYRRDHNEIKNDRIMDKYVEKVKANIGLRFG